MTPFRVLIRHRWYSALVIVTMALGLGGAIALCAVVDVPFFRALPFPDGDRLVVIQGVRLASGEAVGRMPAPFYEAVLRHRGLELVSLVRPQTLIAIADGSADTWTGAAVSPHTFSLLGLWPTLGRLFVPEDYERGGGGAGADTPLLISSTLWSGRLGGDPDIIGKRIPCEGRTGRVVGVFPAETLVPAHPRPIRPDFLMPLPAMTAAQMQAEEVPAPIARMRAGLTFLDVQAEMSTQLGPVADRYPQLFTVAAMKMSTLRDFMYRGQRRIYVLLSWAALVILVAICLNAANLHLARLRHTQQNVALQRALGASRRRLLTEMFGQNLLLAACAVPGGLAVASLICSYLRSGAPAAMAVHVAPAVDLRTSAIGLVLSACVAVVMSCVAAPQTLRLADGEGGSLRSTPGAGRRTRAWQSVLAAVQVCVVLALLIGASLMVHSLVRLARLPVGAVVDNVLLFEPRLRATGYSGVRAKQFWDQLVERVERHPDVISAAAGFSMPMMHTFPWASLAGRDGTDWEARGAMVPVSRQYFEALGVSVTQGRTFSPQEDRTSAAVGVVNETAARTFWPDGNPIGRTFFTPWFTHPYTVIGVVADSRFNQQIESVPTMYVPVWTHKALPLTLLVRAREDTAALRAWVAAEVRQIEPAAVMAPPTTYASEIADLRQRPQFLASLLVVFALLILSVAAIGTAAVVGYGVRLRYRELGIRLALGASRRTICGLVLKDTLRATAVGIGGGVVAASFFGRLLQHELFGTQPVDPATYAAAIVVLLAAVIGAGGVPAWLATRTDPSITLRHE